MAKHLTEVAEPTVEVAQLPRLEPLSYDAVDAETQEAWEELRPPAGGPRHQPGVEHDLFRIMMRHPGLMRVHQPFVQYMKKPPMLPPRDRELVIVRSAWLGGVDDQFVNHSKIGMDCGLTEDEVARIPDGPDASGWSAEDAALLRAVDELHVWCRIGDDTWTALAGHYSDQQLLELLLLVGNYRTLSYVQNSVGIRPVTGTSPNIPGNRFLFPAS
jgi:4-carboxymuconolactone decarboxylase